MKRKKEPTHKELIDAMNLLCEYVADHLPEEYEIALRMRYGESELELIDVEGDEIEVQSDAGRSSIIDMCEEAHRLDRELLGDSDDE